MIRCLHPIKSYLLLASSLLQLLQQYATNVAFPRQYLTSLCPWLCLFLSSNWQQMSLTATQLSRWKSFALVGLLCCCQCCSKGYHMSNVTWYECNVFCQTKYVYAFMCATCTCPPKSSPSSITYTKGGTQHTRKTTSRFYAMLPIFFFTHTHTHTLPPIHRNSQK